MLCNVVGAVGTPLLFLRLNTRRRDICVPRQVAMVAMRRLDPTISRLEAGAMFGRKHPAVANAEKRALNDPEFEKEVARVVAAVEAPRP